MAKNLNEEYRVSMRFEADTDRARRQLADLQKQLNSLATSAGSKKLNFNEELSQASKAAAELSAHLQHAVNLKTGTLDFSKLNASLKESGQSLANYAEQLLKLGPNGQQAFQKLATAVSNSEIPIRRISNALREMGVTLKNTIKWQISSSAIHSFMGAIQGAYGYAQNLNESLNNIRIVTGQNIEQMERFAATANKAAKALSTSTLNYTDAALIYYQQGLSDQEVKARTDVTVKMANVTGDTAEKVSQQLTAVWNNFAKGSQNLEYFADVMTALGAATASSTDEISEGLEKFSAVAQTVGLSYEYATAALATVTATTRESASVVGNAFKTLFARLEGLKLGETLDDGTDLNKYSQALATIGVNIKDASGQLRAMDDILDDMAKRWGTLDKATQMATAQTVGGVRQYNTLIALMENWDFMQENLNTARNATGELQKQADIYAESWEGASKRVKAATETIFQSIINDKFFISILDDTEKVLEYINSLIKSLGGVPGILTLIGTVFTKVFEQQIMQGLQNLSYNLQTLTIHGRNKLAQEKQASVNSLLGIMPTMSQNEGDFGEHAADITATETLTKLNELQVTYVQNAEKYNDIQRTTNSLLLEEVETKRKLVNQTGFVRDTTSEKSGQIIEGFSTYATSVKVQNRNEFNEEYQAYQNSSLQASFITKFRQELQGTQREGQQFTQFITKIKNVLSRFANDPSLSSFDILRKKINETDLTAEDLLKTLEELLVGAGGDSGLNQHMKNKLRNLESMLQNAEHPELEGNFTDEAFLDSMQEAETQVNNFSNAVQANSEAIADNVMAKANYQQQADDINQILQVTTQNYATFSSVLVQGSQSVMALSSSLSMMTGIMDSLWDGITNGTLTTKDVIANVTTLGMLIPTLLSGLNSLKTIEDGLNLTRQARNLAEDKNITLAQAKHILDLRAAGDSGIKEKAFLKEIAVQKTQNTVEEENTIITNINAAAWKAHPIMWIAGIIMGVVAVITVLNKIEEENTKKLQENADKAKEVADKHQELIDKHNDLIQSFNEQIKKYEESNEVTNDLIDSTIKLADAYGIEDARLRILQGNYKEVIALIQQKRLAELQDQQTENTRQIQANQLLLQDTNKKTSSVYANTINAPYLLQAFKEAGYDIGEFTFNDTANIEDFVKKYELYQDLISRGQELANNANKNEDIKFANNFLDKYKNIYDAVKPTLESNQNSLVEQTILGNITGKDIDTLEDFHKVYIKILNDLNNTEDAAKKVQQYFKGNALYSEFAINEELLQSASNQTGGLLSYTQLANIYNSLSDEQKKIFFTIDFKKQNTEEAIRKALQEAQTVANTTTVQVNLNAASNAAKKLKNKMSEEDYASFKDDSGIAWGEKDIIEYSQFLTLSYKEQEAYLNHLVYTYRKALIPSIKESLELEQGKHNAQGTGSIDQQLIYAYRDQKMYEELAQRAKANGNRDAFEEFSEAAKNAWYNIVNLNQEIANSEAETKALEEQLNNAIYAYAATAESLDDLQVVQDYFNESNITEGEQLRAVSIALQSIAEKYDTCTDELRDFQFALTTNNKELIKSAEATLEYSIYTAELAEKMDLEVDDIEDQARAYQNSNEALKDQKDTATQMAVLNQSMNKGVAALTKNWDTWSKTLKKADKNSMDYFDTIQELRTVLKDLTGVLNEDFIPKDFFEAEENMELMQKAAKGNVQAINLLGTALAKASVEGMQFTEGMQVGLEAFILGSGISTEEFNPFSASEQAFDYYKNNVLEGITALNEAILNGTVTAGKDITELMDGTGASWVDSLNAMAKATGMSVDYMRSLLNELGVQAEVNVESVPTVHHVPVYRTYTSTEQPSDIKGYDTYTETSSAIVRYDDIPGEIEVAQINMGSKNAGQKPKINYAGRGTPSKASLTKTGSGKGKTAKKESDIERYHEIKSIIKDLTKEYDRLDKAKERAFGQGKLDYLDQEIALYDKLIEADERYLAEARGWLDVDREKANAAARAMGFGEFNDQTNWTDVQYALANYYNQHLDDEEALKQYETWTKDIQQYIDTYDIVKEREDQWLQDHREQQDRIFEKWNEKIELKMDIDERSRKLIDLKLKALGDSFYKRVEAAWLMLEQLGLANAGHMDITKATGDYKFLEDAFNEVKDLNLSPEQQAEAYGLVLDKATEAANALLDMRQQMLEYYGQTISQMREEWEKGDTQFGHLMTTLEHYDKLLDLTGQGKNYDKRLAVLKGELEVSKNQLNVHQSELEIMQRQEEEMQRQYQQALGTGDAYAIEFAKRNLEVAQDTVRELTETVQQDIEKIAEEAKEVLTTSLEKIYSEYEKKLTQGVGFDYLNQIMDLQAEKADLVLTETNKIYETNKLMNMLDRDMDKTSNTMFKNRLNNFKQEIKVMQERGELTHFELEDAQLRYEVLKAQIALEEAQNAKSTVRLQRDSEGNFGYVYTGDREKMSEAQDNLDKANNDRYNHALEAQEKFLREYYNKQKEFQDAMNELDEQRLEGIITEEEYQKRRLELVNYYTPLLETLEQDHLSAIQVMNETSATHANDSWTQALIGEGYGLQGKTQQWRDTSIKLIDEVSQEFTIWKDNIDQIVEPAVTGDLNAMRDAVQEITDKATALNDYMTSTLFPSQEEELLKTNEQTKEFIDQSTKISELIDWYKQLAIDACKAINEIHEAIDNLPNEKIITIREVYIPADTGGGGNTGGTVIKTGAEDDDTGNKKGTAEKIAYGLMDEAHGLLASGLTLKAAIELGEELRKKSGVEKTPDNEIQLFKITKSGNEFTGKTFASGGYTGEWGPSGKLAFLHQKELVLNSDDTRNFLAGISILRDITSMIDLQAAAMGAVDSWSSIAAPAANRNLDQNVTIHAEFPNVTQHNEIELAFADLINRASQYANRA